MGISVGLIVFLALIGLCLLILFSTSVYKDWAFLGFLSVMSFLVIAIVLGPFFSNTYYSVDRELVTDEINILKTDNAVLVLVETDNGNINYTFNSHKDYLRIDSNTIFVYDIFYNYYSHEMKREFKIQD